MEPVISFLISVFFSALLFLNSTVKNENQKTKPNILIILADDMGYAEPGCYGGISKTPNLDWLAQQGVSFSDFYSGAPNCSPSRAALLTGKSPVKTGMYSYRSPNHPMHLRAEEITIAEFLKEEGYQTSIFGKWHLGCLPQDKNLNQPQPDDHGFDYYFATENNAEPSHFNPENFIRNGKPTGRINGYSCQIVADEAIVWFNKYHVKHNPFLMVLAFHEPHASTQWTAPPEMVKNYNQYNESAANGFANVQNLDSATGRILTHLVNNNLLENTIVIFASDNGSYRQKANGELKAVKSYLYEGGIRVPAIIYWQELKLKPGTIIDQPAGLVDIMPTIREILGSDSFHRKELDGSSILNLLEGKVFERENPLFWFFYRTSPEIAIRIDNHMIMGKDDDKIPRTHEFSADDMSYIKNMAIKDYEVYDLKKDISQSHNIYNLIPESNDYRLLIDKKLEEIKDEGYHWKELPLLINQPRKRKTEWVKF
jgi:arylsulfatase A